MDINIDPGITIGGGIIISPSPTVQPRTPHTVTAMGNGQVSTAQVKFGTGSYTSNALSGYLKVTPFNDFAFGTGDFTIELWYYPTVTNVDATVIGFRPAGVNGPYPTITALNGGSVGYYANTAFRITSAANALTTNTWNSNAVSRSSGNTKMFINGNQVGTTYVDTNNFLASNCIIGSNDFSQNGANPIRGYLDEIRISNIGRYTGNYTPATQAFSTDQYTLLLIHCDGSNGSTTFTDVSHSV